MSSVQKWSRCSRHASRYICSHSLSGLTETLTRLRSIQPLLRPGPLSLGAFSPVAITRSRLLLEYTSFLRLRESSKLLTLSAMLSLL